MLFFSYLPPPKSLFFNAIIRLTSTVNHNQNPQILKIKTGSEMSVLNTGILLTNMKGQNVSGDLI